MYAMGCKYLCPALKIAAIGNYTTRINKGGVDVDDFANSIAIAYNIDGDDSDGILDCVLNAMVKQNKKLLAPKEVQDAIAREPGLMEMLHLKQCATKP
jgi:hypothetical protein